jgi:hypothetical protein
MRKLITGASIFLIFLSVCVLLRTVLNPHPSKLKSVVTAAATPTPNPNVQLASTAPASAPIPQSAPEPIPLSNSTFEPLKSRVVNHQPDQFRTGALGKEQLIAIEKAIKSIPWSLNSNPEAAAKEDYSAIVKECEKSGENDLLEDLIAEAASNDYQPNNETANAVYSTDLTADFENGHQSSNGKNTGEMIAGQVQGADKALTPTLNRPDTPAAAATSSPVPGLPPAEITRVKTVRARHHSIVRRRIVDAKTRLLELWHQSLDQTEKPPKL